jgi:hypothetical protein
MTGILILGQEGKALLAKSCRGGLIFLLGLTSEILRFAQDDNGFFFDFEKESSKKEGHCESPCPD